MSDLMIDQKRFSLVIEMLTKKARLIFLTNALLLAASTILFLCTVTKLFNGSITLIIIAAATIFTLVFLIILNSKRFKFIHPDNMIEHINRNIPHYEESLQLFKITPGSETDLQLLQLKKLDTLFHKDVETNRFEKILPKLKLKIAGMIITASVLLYFSDDFLSSLVSSALMTTSSQQEVLERDKSIGHLQPTITEQRVTISPPDYTGLNKRQTNELNFSIEEASSVEWEIGFSHGDLDYFLVSSDNQKYPLVKNERGYFVLNKVFSQTSFYRLTYIQNNQEVDFPQVYSIEVIRDRPPKVRIIQPEQSLVEIEKDGSALFSLEALVSDDYRVDKVTILASVAKGSGEAVKFRDRQFTFSGFEQTQRGQKYHRNWSLSELDMEPGDEVYFSIVALDNRLPKPQRTKSSSVIVRWLDDEVVELAAEGIQINFIPEFFRSQRQIIIETEQLIVDRKDLSAEKMKETSIDLGYSQRDLKEKYGQYLGDEFGEGEGESFGLADGYHGGEDNVAGEASISLNSSKDAHEAGHGADHESGKKSDQSESSGKLNSPEVGHLHEDMVDPADRSGASELIARFAHNHGSIETASLSKRDPKSWMKKAVNEMWQAELHLMLSEPEKALPFEYKAYDYLKLARQADRIYVKRLGFEPPPVKEDKRLTGELRDILEYSLTLTDEIDSDADNYLFQQSHLLLSRLRANESLTDEQQLLLSKLRARLLQMLESRPALIHYAATVERLLVAKNIQLYDCENCIDKLKQKLWQLMPEPASLPNIRERGVQLDNERLQFYLESIGKQKKYLLPENSQKKGTGNG